MTTINDFFINVYKRPITLNKNIEPENILFIQGFYKKLYIIDRNDINNDNINVLSLDNIHHTGYIDDVLKYYNYHFDNVVYPYAVIKTEFEMLNESISLIQRYNHFCHDRESWKNANVIIKLESDMDNSYSINYYMNLNIINNVIIGKREPRSPLLFSMLEQSKRDNLYDKTFLDMKNILTNPITEEYDINKQLLINFKDDYKLYNYQKNDIHWMKQIETDVDSGNNVIEYNYTTSYDALNYFIVLNNNLIPKQFGIMQNYQTNRFEYYGGNLISEVGLGKCHAIDTPILMFDGSIKMVQNIQKGELLMGDNSTPRRVLSLARGTDLMYDIIQDGVERYTVNQEHILCLKSIRSQQVIEISVKDYLKLPPNIKETLRGYRIAIDFPEKKLDIDPYVIGFEITTQEGNKHIPIEYKCNSRENRLKLLAGLLDNNGSLNDNSVFEFVHKSEKLISDILYIVRSLGLVCYKDVGKISISGNIHEIPTKYFSLESNNSSLKNVLYTDITVKEVGYDNYYGFEIDDNRRYVMGDFTVTHNTLITLGHIANTRYNNFDVYIEEDNTCSYFYKRGIKKGKSCKRERTTELYCNEHQNALFIDKHEY